MSMFDILDTVPQQSFDDLTLLAATVCSAPISLVSVIGRDEQWLKAYHGIDLESAPDDFSFCAHTIHTPDRIVVVPDVTADPRFTDNPLVTGEPLIRFYAGAALVTNDGHAFGTLCVFDRKPRTLEPNQRAALEALARQSAVRLKLHSTQQALQRALESARVYQTKLEDYQRRLHALNTQLQTQAITDVLTGLHNRLAFSQRLNQAVAAAQRADSALSLLLIDIDRFKSLNDSFGHLAGDDTLRQLAEIIRSATREADMLARYGGEEFVVILTNTTSDGAVALAERIRRHVQSAHLPHRNVTVSIGVVTRYGSAPRCSAELLFQDADLALYRAKDAGRNCTRVAAATDQ